jgi:hypothetical protein
VDIKYRNLTDADFIQWCNFIEQAYGKNYILTDWPYLKWFMGGAPGRQLNGYETLIAVLPDGKIIGISGIIPYRLIVQNKLYSFYWSCNNMVLPEFQNHGILNNFWNIAFGKFDVHGGLGFNSTMQHIAQKAGFNLFNNRTLRRFIKLLYPEAYSLPTQIGFDAMQAQELVPLSIDNFSFRNEVIPIIAFDESVEGSMHTMVSRVKVMTLREAPNLNWRYFMNPRITYECKDLIAYLIARHICFFPTEIYGTRIIDIAGSPEFAAILVENEIAQAKERHDALVDFVFAGNFYEDVMKILTFSELVGPTYEWWPLVTMPIERRQNTEFIRLGSHKFPHLFDDIQFNDLYFTRGDSDRDRANIMKSTYVSHDLDWMANRA